MTVFSVVEPLLAQAARIRLGLDLIQTETQSALHEFVEATLPGRVQTSEVRLEVMVGEPSGVILQTGRTRNADLVVMGTHGLGGFRKFLLGSTTDQVLRHAECPVLAVPTGAVNAPAAEHPGVQLKKILLATDFRESAIAAMEWAGNLAYEIGISLVLAHVVEPVIVPPPWQALVTDFENDRVASGRRMLGRLSATLPNTKNDCVISIGRPAETIASLAVEYGAGLVVMGLANPEDPESRRPGSIAYRVLRTAHVAVVVVPRSEAYGAPDRPTDSQALESPEHIGQSSPQT